MLEISVQTKNVIDYENPMPGFVLLKETGFQAVDFSLNDFLKNKDLYKKELNEFFNQSVEELCQYFEPMKKAAKECGISIHQMHMPYPNYVPKGSKELNDYLQNVVAVKSMELCHYLDCNYIVIHGVKMMEYVGSEELEWQQTKEFLEKLAPMAKEYGITMCIENIYISSGAHLVEGPCSNARKAAERIDEMNEKFGAEVLGFCFDTGHANLIGLDFEQFIMILGHRLKVLHIHDNDGIADLHQMPFTFTKTRDNNPSTDWEGFIRALKSINYKGNLNFETAPVLDSFPKELRETTLGMIGAIGNYFKNQLKNENFVG